MFYSCVSSHFLYSHVFRPEKKNVTQMGPNEVTLKNLLLYIQKYIYPAHRPVFFFEGSVGSCRWGEGAFDRSISGENFDGPGLLVRRYLEPEKHTQNTKPQGGMTGRLGVYSLWKLLGPFEVTYDSLVLCSTLRVWEFSSFVAPGGKMPERKSRTDI